MGVPLGLSEIQQEESTQDGEAKNDVSDPNLYKKVVRAADGLKFNGLHLQKAYKAGKSSMKEIFTPNQHVNYRCHYCYFSTISRI